METKKIPIEWNGQKIDVEIKKLTFGEKNDIQEQAVTIKLIGTSMQTNLSQKVLKEQTIVVGIKSAPFEVNLEGIRKLPADIGDKLFDEINEFNTVTPQKKAE